MEEENNVLSQAPDAEALGAGEECNVCYYEGQPYSIGSERCGEDGHSMYVCDTGNNGPYWRMSVGANYPLCEPHHGGSSEGSVESEAPALDTAY
jgi:hypothetical protein